jgi:hypothetical protein
MDAPSSRSSLLELLAATLALVEQVRVMVRATQLTLDDVAREVERDRSADLGGLRARRVGAAPSTLRDVLAEVGLDGVLVEVRAGVWRRLDWVTWGELVGAPRHVPSVPPF